MRDKFMTKYSTEFKEAAVRKMMPPNAMPVREVRQDTGITNVTLYKWRNEYTSKGIAVPKDDIVSKVLTYSLAQATVGDAFFASCIHTRGPRKISVPLFTPSYKR